MIAAALALLLASQTPLVVGPGEEWADDLVAEHKVDPQYPQMAAAMMASGICWISYDVDMEGRAENYCTRCTAQVGIYNTEEHNARGADIAARDFIHASKSAVSQWRYGDEHRPYTEVRTVFVYLMQGQTEDDLPEEPRDLPCSERPQA